MMNFGLGESQIVEFSPAMPYHGAFFFRTNQHGSCWKPARQHRPSLVPDDLLVMQEPDLQQAIQYLARELGCMPHVRGLDARDERERFGPVSACIARDSRLGVTAR